MVEGHYLLCWPLTISHLRASFKIQFLNNLLGIFLSIVRVSDLDLVNSHRCYLRTLRNTQSLSMLRALAVWLFYYPFILKLMG